MTWQLRSSSPRQRIIRDETTDAWFLSCSSKSFLFASFCCEITCPVRPQPVGAVLFPCGHSCRRPQVRMAQRRNSNGTRHFERYRSCPDPSFRCLAQRMTCPRGDCKTCHQGRLSPRRLTTDRQRDCAPEDRPCAAQPSRCRLQLHIRRP